MRRVHPWVDVVVGGVGQALTMAPIVKAKRAATWTGVFMATGIRGRELVTISRTWRELVEVKTLTNSGISAPARVPQLMMLASFHHKELSPPSVGIIMELMT